MRTLTSACLPPRTASRARASAGASSANVSTRSPWPPCDAHDFLERRRGRQIGEELAVVLARRAVLEHRERRAAHRAIAAVVEHDRQHRQVELVGDPVAHGRVGEHVGAVADGRDHELLRRRELGAERGAEAPAEPAGRREAVERAGLFARAMIEAQRIFVEDDRVVADRLADRVAEGRGVQRRRASLPSRPSRGARCGARSACARRASTLSFCLRQRRIERCEHDRGRRRDRQGRSGTSASDSARTPDPRRYARRGSPAAGSACARIPRRVALDHDDQVGVADQRPGVVSGMHRMADGQRDRARDCARPPEWRRAPRPSRAPRPRAVRARTRRDDQRPLGLGDPAGQLLDRRRIGMRATPAPGAARSPALVERRRTAARAAAPDRPARAAWSSPSRARAPPRRRPAPACAARSPTSPSRAPCRPGRTSPGPSGSGASASRTRPSR